MYCRFKKSFEFEKYIVSVNNNNLRKQLSILEIEIETGRYNGVTRDNKCCTSYMIESEFHFLLCCTMVSRTTKKISRKYILANSSLCLNVNKIQ